MIRLAFASALVSGLVGKFAPKFKHTDIKCAPDYKKSFLIHISVNGNLLESLYTEGDWNGLISVNSTKNSTTVQIGNQMFALPYELGSYEWKANLKKGTFKEMKGTSK